MRRRLTATLLAAQRARRFATWWSTAGCTTAARWTRCAPLLLRLCAPSSL